MKVRMDFVTNSSSSSFVITTKMEIVPRPFKKLDHIDTEEHFIHSLYKTGCTEFGIPNKKLLNLFDKYQFNQTQKEIAIIYSNHFINYDNEDYGNIYAELLDKYDLIRSKLDDDEKMDPIYFTEIIDRYKQHSIEYILNNKNTKILIQEEY